MSLILKLRDFTNDNHPFGNKQGKEVLSKLTEFVDEHPTAKIVGISLEGIEATDASFPRESVISLIKLFRGEKGFYLINIPHKDIADNWDYAAKAKDQAIIVKLTKGYSLIGPEISAGEKELLDFVMRENEVTTSKIVSAFKLSAQNASAKLKRLYTRGLIIGRKETAETGGLEFIYKAIK